MGETDVQVRELLQAKAEEMRLDPRIPRPVLRRARRRRVATAVAVGMVAVGIALAGVAGLRASLVAEPPVGPADPGTWRGIWPQDTRADAEAAQEAADAGDPDAVWQLDSQEVVERFGFEELTWDRVFDGGGILSGGGTLTVRIGDCNTVATESCPREADVTIERLVRPDATGIWSVTHVGVEEQASLITPRRLARDFMNARITQVESAIQDMMSEEARGLYESGQGGLSLNGPVEDPAFQGLQYRILSVTPGEQGAGAHLAQVEVTQLFEGGRTVTMIEGLVLGPGTTVGGDRLPLVVLRAEVLSPDVPPTEGKVESLVSAFLEARLAGSGAEEFLTEVAAEQYLNHEGGLYLYGEEHDPGLRWNYAGGGVVSVQAVDANSYEVVVGLSLERDGDHRTLHETLFVGSEEIGLMIRGAVRNEG